MNRGLAAVTGHAGLSAKPFSREVSVEPFSGENDFTDTFFPRILSSLEEGTREAVFRERQNPESVPVNHSLQSGRSKPSAEGNFFSCRLCCGVLPLFFFNGFCQSGVSLR